jgi:hypothetical protein
MLKIKNPENIFVRQKIYHTQVQISEQTPIEKKDVVVVYKDTADSLSSSQTEMLNKLVLACKFLLNDAVYLNATKVNGTISTLQKKYQPKLILAMGEVNLGIHLNMLPKYSAAEINNTYIIKTETPSRLESSKVEKETLWKVLKTSLNI